MSDTPRNPDCPARRTDAAMIRAMTAIPSAADRAADRKANIIYRTSVERRARLKERAAAHGVSVQVYLDALLWDEPLAPDRISGPKRQQELELTG